MSADALVAVLAALGGGGFIIQAISAIRAWREGVRQREEAGDERLLARYERRVDELELRVEHGEQYIRSLIEALGMAGIPIPPRDHGKR